MPKRPDYGNATPKDLARALLRPTRPREGKRDAPRRETPQERKKPG